MNSDEFDQHAGTIAAMVTERREHTASGGCPNPACLGQAGMEAFRNAAGLDPIWPHNIALVAITLLADASGRLDELERLLEAQRGLTADAAAQAMNLDADLVDAHGQIAGLEQRVSGLLAEVTAWEESADVIGPVLPVADHE